MDRCIICGCDGSSYPLDSHHIQYQTFFNKYDFNKDKLSNLVVLCKTHHDEVHNDKLNIIGYDDTIKGKIINYNINDKNIDEKKRKKYDKNDIQIMKDLFIKINNMNHVILELKNNYNINISIKTLKKILNDEY